jgi:hypothetical protein
MAGYFPSVVSPFPVFPLNERFSIQATPDTRISQPANVDMFTLPLANELSTADGRQQVDLQTLSDSSGNLSYLYNPYFPGSNMRGAQHRWNNDVIVAPPVCIDALPPITVAQPVMVSIAKPIPQIVSADLKNSVARNSSQLW